MEKLMSRQFNGNIDSSKFKDKNVSFLLAGSVTRTIENRGLSQAGIPGFLHLTPTLDAEFVADGIPYSLTGVAETPKGVPTPAITVRAVHELAPFSEILNLDIGFTDIPKCKNGTLKQFGIVPSGNIATDSSINSEEIFNKGLEFGESFIPKGDYIILAESTPSGTTTAYATAKALGFNIDGKFSSSFKDVPNSIKEDVVNRALKRVPLNANIWDKLNKVSDNMLLFSAGFVVGATPNYDVVLGGGTQMSAVLAILNILEKENIATFNANNLSLMTTRWVYEDENSDIKSILEEVAPQVSAFYSEFSFKKSMHPALKLYDIGEAKEGVGLGSVLCYASLNGVSDTDIIKKVEGFLS